MMPTRLQAGDPAAKYKKLSRKDKDGFLDIQVRLRLATLLLLLRWMGILSGEAILLFSFLEEQNAVNCLGKEFAPGGANSFHKKLTTFLKGFVIQVSK